MSTNKASGFYICPCASTSTAPRGQNLATRAVIAPPKRRWGEHEERKSQVASCMRRAACEKSRPHQAQGSALKIQSSLRSSFDDSLNTTVTFVTVRTVTISYQTPSFRMRMFHPFKVSAIVGFSQTTELGVRYVIAQWSCGSCF